MSKPETVSKHTATHSQAPCLRVCYGYKDCAILVWVVPQFMLAKTLVSAHITKSFCFRPKSFFLFFVLLHARQRKEDQDLTHVRSEHCCQRSSQAENTFFKGLFFKRPKSQEPLRGPCYGPSRVLGGP